MKKVITALTIALCIISVTACSNKKNSDSSLSETEISQNTDISRDETYEAEEITEFSETADISAKADETTAYVSESGDIPHYPEGSEEFEEQLNTDVIAAAQELFDKACETEWNFTVGSPYSIDTSQYVTNEYGWQFYLITAEGINSLDDVRADYHEVFSEKYPDSLDEVFMEDGGHAYCLNGARGSDIFYEGSEVVEVTGRSDGEICFKVINSYSDDGFGGGAYTEEADFTVIRDSDGAWRVGKFKLPY